jgi:hypothetical protein
MSVQAAFDSLMATLRTTRIRVLPDVGQAVDSPPALVVPPPTLSYDVYSPEPTGASFKVALVVAQDERAAERLFALLPAVVQAIYDSEDAAVAADVEPGSWGSPPLPCYLLTIEVSV